MLDLDESQIEQHPSFAALARESDPSLFEQGLFQLGSHLESRGDESLASRVYASVQGEVAAKAQRRLQALQGGGEVGARCELLFRHFAQETLNPATLFGLSMAGAVFRLSRFGMLANLANRPAQILTRGAGARTLSGLIAYSAEATAFPLSLRLSQNFLCGSDGHPASLLTDLSRSFLALGALRLSASALRLLPTGSSLAAKALVPFGMVSGLFAVHRLEEKLGWRPTTPTSIAWVDSLVLFFQFQAAGRLSETLLGKGWRRWSKTLDYQASIPFHLNLSGEHIHLAVRQPLGPPRFRSDTFNDQSPAKLPSSPNVRDTGPKAVSSHLNKPKTLAELKTETGPSFEEFQAEAQHLAHDVVGGLTSLTYSLPLIREWMMELNQIQMLLIRHHREIGGKLPPDLAQRIGSFHRTVIRDENPKASLAKVPGSKAKQVDRQMAEISGVVFRLMETLESRVKELIDITDDFRNLAAGSQGFPPFRMDYLLEEGFLQGHLGATARLSTHFTPNILVPGPQRTIGRLLQNLLVNTREALQGKELFLVRVMTYPMNVSPKMLNELLTPEFGFAPQAGDYWVIRIQDNGPGIPPDILPRIFESGFSTKNSETRPVGAPASRGLGLAQVHKAVRERGGFIRVESTVGRGTSFEVYLPDMNSRP